MRNDSELQHEDSSHRIAVVKWRDVDGIAKPMGDELISLGHKVTYFLDTESIPKNVDIIFSFAPYDRFLQIPQKLSQYPKDKRPLLLHRR